MSWWRTYRGGVWIWGIILAAWLGAIVLILVSGLCVPKCDDNAGGSPYCIVTSNNGLIASLTAVLGVIWSWFIQMEQKQRHFNEKPKTVDQ